MTPPDYYYADPKTRVTIDVTGNLMTFTEGHWIGHSPAIQECVDYLHFLMNNGVTRAHCTSRHALATEVVHHIMAFVGWPYTEVKVELGPREDIVPGKIT